MHNRSKRAYEPVKIFTLTREQVRMVDRIAIEQLGIPGIVLMENAAIALREAAMELINEQSISRAIICCGPGNNGGDGLALARQLANRLGPSGFEIEIRLSGERDGYQGDAKVNFDVCQRMGLLPASADVQQMINAMEDTDPDNHSTLVVDALLGTGATRPPEGSIAAMVAWINQCKSGGAIVLAVDVPTGLDCDTGLPLGDDSDLVVHANLTMTLCAMKPGLALEQAHQFTGEVVVGDIGVPVEMIEECEGKRKAGSDKRK